MREGGRDPRRGHAGPALSWLVERSTVRPATRSPPPEEGPSPTAGCGTRGAVRARALRWGGAGRTAVRRRRGARIRDGVDRRRCAGTALGLPPTVARAAGGWCGRRVGSGRRELAGLPAPLVRAGRQGEARNRQRGGVATRRRRAGHRQAPRRLARRWKQARAAACGGAAGHGRQWEEPRAGVSGAALIAAR
uniref:Uncharacterized protein n=1 Tax=Oryza glumipatula TaxID=40148 RepID=A0A0D9ZYM2_9ORYZ